MAGDAAKTICAIIITLLVMVVGLVGLRSYRTHSDPYVPSPEEADAHQTLHDLLAKVDAVFRRNKITYWPMGGTMLGAIRHQGMIPWDDDIDIGIWKKDLPRAEQAIRAELAGQARWWEGTRCHKVMPAGRLDTVIDVFPMEQMPTAAGPVIAFSNPAAREYWPREYFTLKEFGAGGKRLPFGALTLYGPDKPCSYLSRAYPNWERRGYNTENHTRSSIRRLGAAVAPATYIFSGAESRQLCEA
jgi:hypothetical protein